MSYYEINMVIFENSKMRKRLSGEVHRPNIIRYII